MSRIAGTIVTGPINFNKTPTNPVAPIKKWREPANIKLPSNYIIGNTKLLEN